MTDRLRAFGGGHSSNYRKLWSSSALSNLADGGHRLIGRVG